MKVKNRAGFTKLEWRKVQERNEALDCRIYARAAAYAIGIDRWNEDKWRRAQGFSPAPTPAEPRDTLPEGSRAPEPSGSDPFRASSTPSGRPRRGGGWLHRRR
jgi:phage terminase large subunit GpA-like protein